MKVVTYYRVSTTKQGVSGLGLEAQQAQVTAFLANKPHEIIAEFVEVQSSNVKKNRQRPKLAEAMRLCEEHGATLVVAKLDRLHRNVRATAALIEANFDFICVDNPDVDKFTLQILSCVAEKELEDISNRTKASLAMKKARGFQLGKPENFTNETRALGTQATNAKKQDNADQFAVKMFPTLAYLMYTRKMNLTQTAEELNRRGLTTSKGRVGSWDATKVRRCMSRAERVEAKNCVNF